MHRKRDLREGVACLHIVTCLLQPINGKVKFDDDAVMHQTQRWLRSSLAGP